MRKFGLFLCLSLLCAFTGCSDSDDVEEQYGTVLAKPTVTVTTTTATSFKAAWEAVPNAESYKYRLSQENETGGEVDVQSESTTSATALTFSDLDPKTKYILRVKAAANAQSGLSDSNYAKVFAVTLNATPVKLTFDKIAVQNATYESVDVEIVPAADNLYYWQVVENSLIEGKTDREVVAALQNQIIELSSGTVKKTVRGLKAQTAYTVVAFGYDLDAGKKTSDVARLAKPFSTPADTRMTIAIAVGEITKNSVHVSFKPSTAGGAYFADVMAAEDVTGKTEQEIVAKLQAKYGAAMTDIARTGDFEGDFEIAPGKNYAAVAFAYDTAASELTSKLFTAEIDNSGSGEVSNAWANMAVVYGSVQGGAPALGANVYPNEETSAIKMSILPLSGKATSLEQIGHTVESLRKEILKTGQDLTDNQKLEEGVYQAVSRIEYGGYYLLANVALDAYGNGGEANWIIVKAQTSAQGEPEILAMSEKNEETPGGSEVPPVASDAWADLSAIWENQQSTGNGTPIFFECAPNASTVAIRYIAATIPAAATSLEEVGLTETSLREMVLTDGRDINMERLYAGFGSAANEIWLFAIVASDAEGNYGDVNWIIAQMPAEFSGQAGACTVLGQSANNGSGGGSGGGGGSDLELKSASYEDYLGNWTLVSSGAFVLTDGISITKDPLYYSIRIDKDVEGQSYKVYGWNTDTEFANAHPFVMNYDPTESGGISGWVNIPLAQLLATEGNIDWMLCPRFVAGTSYYSYPNTDMEDAFFGATEASGMVLIVGNTYEFTGIGEADMQAMSLIGYDRTDENAQPLTRPAETTHAMAPFILVKSDPAAAVKRLQGNRMLTNIARRTAAHNNFMRLSTAAVLGSAQPVGSRNPFVPAFEPRTFSNQPVPTFDLSKPKMKVLRR